MARKPSPSERLADLMEQRRIELRLQWTDVAKRGDTTTESIRKARSGKNMRSLTQGAIERGLGWQQGSIREILNGGEPTLLQDVDNTQRHERYAESAVASVLDAIDNDPHLLPEAKAHLKSQYGLLLRINAASAAAAAVDAFDEQRERRIAARTADIHSQRGLTAAQKERYIDAVEDEERRRPRVSPTQDGWRNPHLDVRFEESDDNEPALTEDEAAAALDEELPLREPDPERR